MNATVTKQTGYGVECECGFRCEQHNTRHSAEECAYSHTGFSTETSCGGETGIYRLERKCLSAGKEVGR